MHRTEICRSRTMTSSTVQIFSFVTTVVGRALRGVSPKARVAALNSAIHFAIVPYDGAR